jgi:hypothetical protein
MQGNREQELDQLLAAYRDSMPDLEPSPDFLAQVWRRIEANRPSLWAVVLQAWAPRMAMAGVLGAVLLTASVWIPERQAERDLLLDRSYIEILTVDSLDEHDGAQWIIAGNRLASER